MDTPIEKMSQDDLILLMNKKEFALREANDNYSLADQYDIELARQVIALQLKRKDNAIILSKAKNNVKNITSILREAKSRYFQSRNN